MTKSKRRIAYCLDCGKVLNPIDSPIVQLGKPAIDNYSNDDAVHDAIIHMYATGGKDKRPHKILTFVEEGEVVIGAVKP